MEGTRPDRRTVAQQGLVGELFLPTTQHRGSYPAVLALGGSEGGLRTETARALAEEGYAALQSIEAVKRCVAAGMGVSVLPYVAVEGELRSGELSALAWGGAFDVRTRIAWHGERWQSPALRAFLEAARELFDSAAAPSGRA